MPTISPVRESSVCPAPKGCGATKPIDEFYKRGDGRPQTYCKPCHARLGQLRLEAKRAQYRAKQLEWQANNQDRVKAARARHNAKPIRKEKSRGYEQQPQAKATRRLYKETHHDQIVAAHREYNEQHREEKNRASRERYAANRERVLAEQQLARATSPERFRAATRRYKAKHADAVRAATQRRRDSLRGRGGKISARELRAMFARYDWRCIRCGERKPLAFDHVDPNAPGDVANGQPLCTSCNSWKLRRTGSELDFRLSTGAAYDRRPDLPVGHVDPSMGDLPVPEWLHHPRRQLLADRTEKLCLGPTHGSDGVMLPIESFPIRSKRSGKPFRTTYCRECKNAQQRVRLTPCH